MSEKDDRREALERTELFDFALFAMMGLLANQGVGHLGAEGLAKQAWEVAQMMVKVKPR